MNIVEKKALIIEDEKDVREMLYDIFQEEGFVIETAEDLKTAQRIIGQKPFALISTDDYFPRGGERVGDAFVSRGNGNFAFEINDFVRDVYGRNGWTLPKMVAYSSKNIEDPGNLFTKIFVKPDVMAYQKFLMELK